MLVRIWERLSLCNKLDAIVVATSQHHSNDVIEKVCTREGIGCVRGGVNDTDILGRLLHAAEATSADAVVRITGDCPLIDPGVVDEIVGIWTPRLDYVANCFPDHRTFPDGLDTELFSLECLRFLDRDPFAIREELSRNVWERHGHFRVASVLYRHDLSPLRWTVDTAEDLAFVRRVYEILPEGFGMADILAEFGPLDVA